MQFCTKHWEDLRQAIKDKGMFHLVAPTGEALSKRVDVEITVPDPLFEAHNLLVGRSIDSLGLYIMGGKDVEGEIKHYCPLCEARDKLPAHPESKLPCDESWISTLIDFLHEEYKKGGWINEN